VQIYVTLSEHQGKEGIILVHLTRWLNKLALNVRNYQIKLIEIVKPNKT